MGTITITPSNILALWQLISIVRRNNVITVKDATGIALASGAIAGALPVDQGLRLGQYCRFLEIDNQNLVHTQICIDTLMPHCAEEEPNILVVRVILAKYMSLETMEWLLFYDEDPDVFRSYVPQNWVQLLDNAELFNFDEPEVQKWWIDIFGRFQKYKEGKKIEQGKLAEELTFEWEKQRVDNDGHDNGIKTVKWASLVSDKFGFDILSIRAKLLKYGEAEKDKIRIEVKSTASSSLEEFRFYVTKPEWKTATEKINSYFFYCWADTNLETQKAHGPFIIPASALHAHVPIDKGGIAEWSECRFILDVRKFQINTPPK